MYAIHSRAVEVWTKNAKRSINY